MHPKRALLLATTFSLSSIASSLSAQQGLRLLGDDAESFLLAADVERMENINVGVTRPQKLTLSNGREQCYAAWKTVDIHRRGITRLAGGITEANFRDSYKHEIAAYELDKLLGLRLVPPTVERRIRRVHGSLQMWVDNATTEWDRLEKDLPVQSPREFVEGKLRVGLFHWLTHNIDHKNARNILIGKDGHVWAIDHSRAFRTKEELIEDIKVERFPRAAIERMRELDSDLLKERLGKWLNGGQRDAILARRDLILERVEALIAERGEAAVLFD